jgi:hypothetical protein
MKKILFAAMTAIILCSVFVGIKTSMSNTYNYMSMTPTNNTVNPPLGGSDLTFLYNLTITTNVTDVSAWQCKLLWDPAVLRILQNQTDPDKKPLIEWGDFMTGTTPGKLKNSTSLSSGAEYIILGQNFENETLGVTGSGLLARLNFTFVIPGPTSVRVLDARVWDNALLETLCSGNDGYVKSDRPHAAFAWTTDDEMNPVPDSNIYDAGRNIPYWTTVHFDATGSYDTTNMVWNGTAWELVGGANLTEYMWDFGDGMTSNDMRLDPYVAPYTQYSLVKAGDLDEAWPLVNFQDNETYFDADLSENYTSGDSICLWNGTVNDDGDMIFISDWDSVLFGDAVANESILSAFTIYEMHTDGYSLPNAVYQAAKNNTLYDGTGLLGEYVYMDMQYVRDPKYGAVSAGAVMEDHIYSAYKQTGYLVNLTVWDASGEYWSTTWHYQGPAPTDTVPMWRNVGIVDIWPSLIPYENVEEYDDDWYAWWWYDSTNYILPHTADPYWDYRLPNSYCSSYELDIGTTVKEGWEQLGTFPSRVYGDEGPGLNILVTANNYGSVKEKCLINLYAVGVALKNAGTQALNYNPVTVMSFEKIGTWTRTIGSGLGSGWACTTNWLPSKNATYVLFATIDIADGATMVDKNRADNTYVLPTPVSNLNDWNFTSLSMVPAGWMGAKYLCDIGKGGNGKVEITDLNLLLSQFGAQGPAGSSQIPVSKP